MHFDPAGGSLPIIGFKIRIIPDSAKKMSINATRFFDLLFLSIILGHNPEQTQ